MLTSFKNRRFLRAAVLTDFAYPVCICHPVSNNNGAVKGREERGRLEPNSSAISLLLRTALAHAKNQDSRFALHQGGGSCWLHQPSLRFRPTARNHDFTCELPDSSGRQGAHSSAQSLPATTG